MVKWINGKTAKNNARLRLSAKWQLPPFRLSILPSYPFGALAPALERSEGMEKLKD